MLIWIRALLSTTAGIKTLEGREMLVGLISPPVTDYTCDKLQRASERFSFHFREAFQKCIEYPRYIEKILIQMREILNFW